jgi:internalin A
MSDLALQLIAENKKTRATFLDLANCGLTTVPSEVSQLVWLESLSLSSGWQEWGLEDGIHRRTKNDGGSNKELTDIAAVAGLSNLRSLYLDESQIHDFSPLAGLMCLQLLHVGSAQVSDLSPLAGLMSLQSLHLTGRQIGDLTPLAGLVGLRSLHVAGAQVSDLTPLSGLVGLQSLFVWNSHIESLAPLAGLVGLQSLYVFESKVRDLAPLTGLVGLKTLYVSSSRITDLSPMAGLLGLQALYVLGEQVSNLAPLTGLLGLQMLLISGTQVSDLSPLAGLVNLQSLSLSGKRVSDLAPLVGLVNLKSLSLSGEEISNIASLAGLLNLNSLDVANTKVSGLTPLAGLMGLQSLNVSNTQVSDLSPLKALIAGGRKVMWSAEGWRGDGIYVENCPLRNPPVEIVNQGNDAILNYFREREADGVDHLYEAKLLILGEGGAGKTSLLRRLYQPQKGLPAENETTKGIDIYRHDFNLENGRRFRLNVWDFGGQEIYHATHQFFLTRRSLYLLLDDTRKDNKSVSDPGFKTWLDLIELFGEHSPVLIFQNEKGGRSKEIDLAGIKGQYDNVKERYQGNLEQAGAADQLRRGIEWFAGQLSHIGEELPASWIKIRADIEARSAEVPHIPQQEYFDIYAKYLPFDRTKALLLSRYLHDLGVFLHFQNDPLLARTVILQNPWATEAVYRMLDDESVKAKAGRFGKVDCESVWQGSAYAEMQPELLALMVNFELCYELPNSTLQTWLAPQLLSPSKPTKLVNWGRPDDLVLRYRYAFLPKGIIGRLMVRLHRFVRDPEMASVTCVLFERDTTSVVAELLANGSDIELRARGSERKALLSVVAAELDAVNGFFSGLREKVGKWIPCSCQKCSRTLVPHLFEEKALRKRFEDKRLKVECPDSYAEEDVLALLDGIRIDQLPIWAKEEKTASASRTIKIFLASSAELLEDRDGFELYFRQQNDRYLKKGIYLEIVRWETFFNAMSDTRLQDEYNTALRGCDVFVSLFFTKTGKFTDEEFDAAHSQFKASGLPRIFTFFKDAQVKIGSVRRDDFSSLEGFKDKLKKLEHYPTTYDNLEHLKRQFSDQLDTFLLAEI